MRTQTTTLEMSLFAEVYATMPEPKQKELRVSPEQQLSVRQISHYIGKTQFCETGYNTTTYGRIGFIKVAKEQVTEDVLLQARLDILCDKLRARY